MDAVLPYLPALVLTLLFEVPLALVWLRVRTDVRWPDGLAVAAGVSLVTHPVFWYGYWFVFALHLGHSHTALVVGEALVVVAEAVGYRLALRVPWRDAVGVSVATNLVSATVGSLVYDAWFFTA